MLDREEAMVQDLRRVLGPESEHKSPIESVMSLITDDMYHQANTGLTRGATPSTSPSSAALATCSRSRHR